MNYITGELLNRHYIIGKKIMVYIEKGTDITLTKFEVHRRNKTGNTNKHEHDRMSDELSIGISSLGKLFGTLNE